MSGWGGRGSRGAPGAASTVPGPAGPAPAGSAGDDVYLSASGVAASRTPAAARAAHDATRRTTHTTTGWTLEEGGAGAGSIAAAGGVMRFTLPTSATNTYLSGTWDAPRMRRALTADPWAADVRVRIAAVAGGHDAASSIIVALESDDGGVRTRILAFAAVPFNRQVYFGEFVSAIIPAANFTAALAVDGTGWLRLVWRLGILEGYYGAGVGTAEPTTWRRIVRWVTGGGAADEYIPTHLCVIAAQSGAGAGAWTADIGQVIETTLAEV